MLKKQMLFQLVEPGDRAHYKLLTMDKKSVAGWAEWHDLDVLQITTHSCEFTLAGFSNGKVHKYYAQFTAPQVLLAKIPHCKNDFVVLSPTGKLIGHNFGREMSLCDTSGKILAYMKIVTDNEYLILFESEWQIEVFMALVYYEVTFGKNGKDAGIAPLYASVVSDTAIIPKAKDIRNFLYST